VLHLVVAAAAAGVHRICRLAAVRVPDPALVTLPQPLADKRMSSSFQHQCDVEAPPAAIRCVWRHNPHGFLQQLDNIGCSLSAITQHALNKTEATIIQHRYLNRDAHHNSLKRARCPNDIAEHSAADCCTSQLFLLYLHHLLYLTCNALTGTRGLFICHSFGTLLVSRYSHCMISKQLLPCHRQICQHR
jgi:hypothetical protein